MDKEGRMASQTLVLSIDQPGWAFHNISREIARGLGNLFSTVVIEQSSKLLSPVSGSSVLVCFWWGDTCRLRANLRPGTLITCVYDHESFCSGPANLSPEFLLALRQTDILAVCNEEIRQDIQQRSAGAKLPPIFLVPDGVNTRLFMPSRLPPGPPVIGWCGNSARMGQDKGITDYKGLGLVREACQQAHVELHVLDAAKGNSRSLHEMPPFYHAITCITCMSVREGTPNPILEGMASQRIPISTRVGIAQRMIRDQVNGFLLRERTTGALVEAIEAVKRMAPDARTNMARGARAEVEQRWAWDVTLENWRRCLLAALAIQGQSVPQGLATTRPVSPEVLQPMAQPVAAPALAPAPGPGSEPAGEPRLVSPRGHCGPAEAQARALGVEQMAEDGDVLLLSDVRDWAFHQNMKDLELYLGSKRGFAHWFVIDWCNARIEAQGRQALPAHEVDERIRAAMLRFNTVFCVYHRWGIDAMLPWDRTVGSLRALWFKPEKPGPPTAEDIALVNRFRAFHVVTKQNYDELRDHCPNAVYLTNPVNMNRFPEPTPVSGEVICSWNGNAQHASGACGDVKGFDTIIKPVCEGLKQPLVFAEYHTARLSPAEMPVFYLKANLCLCMSKYEGASNSVMEGMASGHALITTDCGNHREMQRSQIQEFGDTGIVIVERTRDALAQAICMLRADPLRVAEMGRINRAEIEARWSWSVWSQRYEEFLCRAM